MNKVICVKLRSELKDELVSANYLVGKFNLPKFRVEKVGKSYLSLSDEYLKVTDPNQAYCVANHLVKLAKSIVSILDKPSFFFSLIAHDWIIVNHDEENIRVEYSELLQNLGFSFDLPLTRFFDCKNESMTGGFLYQWKILKLKTA